MARIISHNCSNCKTDLDISIFSIGTTHIKCTGCNGLIKTDNTPFSHKNLFGKIYCFIEVIPSALLTWGIGLGVLLSLFDIILPAIMYAIIALIFPYYRIIKQIKNVEFEQKLIEEEFNLKFVKK